MFEQSQFTHNATTVPQDATPTFFAIDENMDVMVSFDTHYELEDGNALFSYTKLYLSVAQVKMLADLTRKAGLALAESTDTEITWGQFEIRDALGVPADPFI